MSPIYDFVSYDGMVNLVAKSVLAELSKINYINFKINHVMNGDGCY